MSNMNVNVNSNMTLMRAQGEQDRQSQASNTARDMMEAMNPMNVIGGILEMIGPLAMMGLSG